MARGGYLAVTETAHLVHDAAQSLVDLLARHRPLLERLLHAGAQLVFVEGLAPTVALDHQRHDQLGGLEGGEALAALQAFAAAAYLPPLARQA